MHPRDEILGTIERIYRNLVFSEALMFLEAYDRLEVLEATAETLINCRAVGTLVPMSDESIRKLERVFLGSEDLS
jgi:hypothetical protein